ARIGAIETRRRNRSIRTEDDRVGAISGTECRLGANHRPYIADLDFNVAEIDRRRRWTCGRRRTYGRTGTRTWRRRRTSRRVKHAYGIRKLEDATLRIVVKKDFAIAVGVVRALVRNCLTELQRGRVGVRFENYEATIRRNVTGERIASGMSHL